MYRLGINVKDSESEILADFPDRESAVLFAAKLRSGSEGFLYTNGPRGEAWVRPSTVTLIRMWEMKKESE